MDAPANSAYLDAAETKLLNEALGCLRAHHEDRAFLESMLRRLNHLGEVIREFPSLYAPEKLAGRYRGPETLIEQLVKRGPFAAPLGMPVRALLARDFVLAKVQTFRAVGMALAARGAPEALCERMLREVGQSIYTLLADHLLVEIVTDADVAPAAKRRAAEILVRFWDRCIEVEIDDFAPLLESVWSARNRLVVEFGTLLGSVETIRLLGSASDPAFLDALLADDATGARRDAFEEFLFGLSYEQLAQVRAAMRSEGLDVVDRAWVARTLDIPEQQLFSGVSDPEAIFTSYQTRQLTASYRRLRGNEGPRHTAEFHLMLHVLETA